MISEQQWRGAANAFLKQAMAALEAGDYRNAKLAAEDAHTTLEELDLVLALRKQRALQNTEPS